MSDPEELGGHAAEVLVRQLIDRQGEDRSLDYKAAMAFADNMVKGKLLKCIMAFANTRDGGSILIGVQQKGLRFEATGLTPEQARTFDPTNIGDFAGNYCSSLPRVSTREVNIDGVRVLVLKVAEFADEPIVCTKDLHDGKGNSILRKGHIYVRSADARCVAIDSSETMRSLLNLAVQKQGGALLEQIRGLVGATPINAATGSTAEQYADELGMAAEMFERESLAGPDPFWFCTIMPTVYEERIGSTARLREIRRQCEVSLRGWNFPHTDRDHDQTFENGIESVTHWAHHNEASRIYRSGLFVWRHGMREDSWPEREGTVSFVSSIYSLLEAFVFASRYAPMIADSGDFVVSVGISNLNGYELMMDTDGFNGRYQTAASTYSGEYVASVADLRSAYRDLATDASRRLFDLFGLDVPPTSVEQWQDRLIGQRL